jgi:lysophospholipase L1-like esterase
VLNAGVSGAKVSDVLSLARTLKLDRVDRVLIAVGINDAKKGARAPIDRVMADYEALVELLSLRGLKVTVATVAPPSVSGVDEYDVGYIATFNTRLRDLVKVSGVGLIDFDGLGSDNGLMPESAVLDGIHLNYDGYRSWHSRISQHCA